MSILKVREQDAKRKSAFMAGASDVHPHGKSGERWLLPPETGKSTWDARMISASEWGNAAGFDMSGMGFSHRGTTLPAQY